MVEVRDKSGFLGINQVLGIIEHLKNHPRIASRITLGAIAFIGFKKDASFQRIPLANLLLLMILKIWISYSPTKFSTVTPAVENIFGSMTSCFTLWQG
ncbi:MAG: hypothetical protein RM021_020140 [Nostoc sp. EkiNYC01]|nr:hypothetical protein [Nostoc sp. EkiNYC01]